MASVIEFLWLFPLMYYFFGGENLWWIFTLMIIVITIIHLAKLDTVLDKLDFEKDMKYDAPYYYLYDFSNHEGGDK